MVFRWPGNGSRFELGDDTAPLYVDGKLPRLPDIESERDNWDIVGSMDKSGTQILFIACDLQR